MAAVSHWCQMLCAMPPALAGRPGPTETVLLNGSKPGGECGAPAAWPQVAATPLCLGIRAAAAAAAAAAAEAMGTGVRAGSCVAAETRPWWWWAPVCAPNGTGALLPLCVFNMSCTLGHALDRARLLWWRMPLFLYHSCVSVRVVCVCVRVCVCVCVCVCACGVCVRAANWSA